MCTYKHLRGRHERVIGLEASQLQANKHIDLWRVYLTSATQKGALSIIPKPGPETRTDKGAAIDSEKCHTFSVALIAPLIRSLREKPWSFNSSIYLFYWLMNPGPGQADKNGLRLQTHARAPCLVGCRSSEAFVFSKVIEIDDRIDRK